jgi:hypothetical protein
MNRFFAVSLPALAFAATPASAAIVMGNITSPAGGTFVKLANPAVLTNIGDRTSQLNGLNQLNLYGFDEAQGVTLGSALAVNLGGPASNNGSIAAGTRVSSHTLFFDPTGTKTAIGSVTFDRKVLGVLRTTARQLATDSQFAPGLSFSNVSARGLEGVDQVLSWTPGSKTVSVNWNASNPGDTLRVVTAAVPEPATWAMMIIGFGLVGGAMRARRQTVRVSFG